MKIIEGKEVYSGHKGDEEVDVALLTYSEADRVMRMHYDSGDGTALITLYYSDNKLDSISVSTAPLEKLKAMFQLIEQVNDETSFEEFGALVETFAGFELNE